MSERQTDPLQVETKGLAHRSNCSQVEGRSVPVLKNSSGTANKALAACPGALSACVSTPNKDRLVFWRPLAFLLRYAAKGNLS